MIQSKPAETMLNVVSSNSSVIKEIVSGKRINGTKTSDGSKTSETTIIQSVVSSKDGNVVFRIINQPEVQHRAR